MSKKLRLSLMDYVSRELQNVQQQHPAQDAPPETIDQAVKTAFVKLDDDVLDVGEAALLQALPLPEAVPALRPATAGSCALFALYDAATLALRVACVGDSRGVLGRRTADGMWKVIPLSEEQTGDNPAEVARLQAAHPDEPEMLEDGLLLGMVITRGFGDGRWKWSAATQQGIKDRYYGKSLRQGLLTPPYLTAEPVVERVEVQPGRDFMIVASDGLWDLLTSEEAVALVGLWLEKREGRGGGAGEERAAVSGDEKAGSTSGEEHVQLPKTSVAFVDDNAATHLARNALGGNDEQVHGRLTFQAPYSRDVRYDIVFGDDEICDQMLTMTFQR